MLCFSYNEISSHNANNLALWQTLGYTGANGCGVAQPLHVSSTFLLWWIKPEPRVRVFFIIFGVPARVRATHGARHAGLRTGCLGFFDGVSKIPI